MYEKKSDEVKADDKRMMQEKYVLYFVPEKGTPWTKKTEVKLSLSEDEQKQYVYPAGSRNAGQSIIPPKYKPKLSGGDGVVIDKTTKDWLLLNYPDLYGGNVTTNNDDDKASFRAMRIDKAKDDIASKDKGFVIKGYYPKPVNWDVPAPQPADSKQIPRH